MVYRLIAPDWLVATGVKKVWEGTFTEERINELNAQGYNAYYLPNYPSTYVEGTNVDGAQVDRFRYVFVDMDLKDGKYPDKETFIKKVNESGLEPSFVIDSGNGVHVYWAVNDLDANGFLRLQRRACRYFETDEAVCKIFQLMRVPGTLNTKKQDSFKLCAVLQMSYKDYTSEELDKFLPKITHSDEEYCKQHYDKTYGLKNTNLVINDRLPIKFSKLLKESREVKEIWRGNTEDRSVADFRLGHIMFAENFTKQEALSVLVNAPKALSRTPVHRSNYAQDIVDKIWTYENNPFTALSSSVRDILKKGSAVKGTRFPCWELYDGTHHGFHLTEVLGLIGGSGSGKTTLALNYFYHFTKNNPDYIHLFVALEQKDDEIALRWQRIAGADSNLHDKVHVMSNYNEDGSHRKLSLPDIETYIIELESRLSVKVGCVVIDHIGALQKTGKEGENQGLIDVCHSMKAFALRTNTFLVMQSQTSREKAGRGDIELDKDAAYGTTMFEWYCDYVVTTWQPLKLIYDQKPDMTCSAFKYCKIRHKNVKKDKSKEDVIHVLMFDPETEYLDQMTQMQETSYTHWSRIATTLRNKDKKREPKQITRIDWVGDKDGRAVNSNKNKPGNKLSH